MNKRLIILVILVVLITILGIFIMLRKSSIPRSQVPKSTNPSAPLTSPTIGGSQSLDTIAVLSIDPDGSNELSPATTPQFTVVFNQPPPSNISILLTESDPTKDVLPTSVKYERLVQGDSLKISPIKNIPSGMRYSLKIGSGVKTLLEQDYKVGFPPEVPSTENSQILKDFLPYETVSYRLVYDSNKNSYVFHFKYNENSPDSLETQFEAAKKAAVSFIKAKGLDVNSVTIEWKYS